MWRCIRQRLGLVLAVALPLLILAWSGLQVYRVDQVRAVADLQRDWLSSGDPALLDRLPVQTRGQWSRMADRREAFTRDLDRIAADSAGLHVRKALAWGSAGLAILACLTSLFAWLNVHLDGWRALRSNVFLHTRLYDRWQALGRWLSGYCGLMAGALAMGGLYELSAAWSYRQGGGLLLVLLGVPMLGACLAAVHLARRLRGRWALLQQTSLPVLGRTLQRGDAPGMWAWIEHLAAKTGAPVPDHIVVGLAEGFFVSSVQVCLLPSEQALHGRVLYLPLTYLSALDQDEAAAVLCHELGHFRGRDTERSSLVCAQFTLMQRQLKAVRSDDESPPWVEQAALWLADASLERFVLAVQHWRRHEELMADQVAAQVVGARPFSQALLRVMALGRVVEPMLATCDPRDVIEGLRARLQQAPLVLDEAVLEQAVVHPLDSHPCTSKRLEQLNVMLDPQLLGQATRVTQATDRAWFERLIRPQDGASRT